MEFAPSLPKTFIPCLVCHYRPLPLPQDHADTAHVNMTCISLTCSWGPCPTSAGEGDYSSCFCFLFYSQVCSWGCQAQYKECTRHTSYMGGKARGWRRQAVLVLHRLCLASPRGSWEHVSPCRQATVSATSPSH